MGKIGDRDNIRNGDVEAILNHTKNTGRPMMSTMIRDSEGRQIFFKRNEKGNAKITEVYDPRE